MTELAASTDSSLYVWLAYTLALLTALWLILWPSIRHRRIWREQQQRLLRKRNAPQAPNTKG